MGVTVGVVVFVAVLVGVWVAVSVAVAVFVAVGVGVATVNLPSVRLGIGSPSLNTKPRCSTELGSV